MDDEYISFEILNERFTIKSNVPKNYYMRLVSYLESKINNIREKIPNLSNVKLLTFAALDVTDELMKQKERSLDEEEVRLISDLSDSLAAIIEEDEGGDEPAA